jgi:hypothetical protein
MPVKEKIEPLKMQVSACIGAEEPGNSQKAPIILQEGRGKKMQEGTMAEGILDTGGYWEAWIAAGG